MAEGSFIAYYRVSTERQGRSGLGLEAQRRAVRDFLNGGSWRLLAEFTEVESGKKDDRPELAKALHQAKVTGSRLVIAKLDRLSRNAAFLLTLQNSGVGFVAADNPHANELTIGILAVVAQDEHQRISERTKVALAAAKARGVKLGNPNGAAHLRHFGSAQATDAAKRQAERRAHDLRDVVADIRASGATSLHQIAAELNRRECRTPRGRAWHAASVKRLLERLAG